MRNRSPQPSTSAAPVGHGSGGVSTATKQGWSIGSPAPRLAAPLPCMKSASYAPHHRALNDISICYKVYVMWLRLFQREVVIEFAGNTTSEGDKLLKGSWDLIAKAKDAVDYHMYSDDKSRDDVRLWVLLKDLHPMWLT